MLSLGGGSDMSGTQLQDQLSVLGFVEKKENVYVCKINNYEIVVTLDPHNIEESTVNYGPYIKVHHNGILKLNKPEHLVQLECVIRLLKKGYSPKKIELEKQYRLGHSEKGRLDILIKKGNKSWAMIECKTFGTEFRREKEKILEDGGQIFSYFAQDRNCSLIALYSSKIEDKRLVFESAEILTKDLDKTGDTKTIHSSWNKEFHRTGIFSEGVSPYDLEMKNLKKSDLLDLTKETGRKLFNSFAEILRRYVISDKSNAFNVIFNLFVCKIFDEDTKSDNEELDFQWKVSDDDETFVARLSRLYFSSLKKYLNVDIDGRYFPKSSSGEPLAIKEFSFIEVNNNETFRLNANILRDVVTLLQKYRVKYSTKHQFLGEFFEQLLNTGVKQEAGQFFTPIPLARFILRSLPIDMIIKSKIERKDPYILPYILDFACGSGHFLTESMTEVEAHFQQINESELSGQQKRLFIPLKSDYLWVRDYIYGIEKDTRLAKTTKIALFLNGDGDATIISGDGLDDFYLSRTYTGRLKSSEKTKSISTFDVLVSNPPFSVDGFINNVPDKENNFSLHKYVTPKSSEIECFFVERMCQVLADNGVAGIILPLSILNNKKPVYVHARLLLLLNFDIMAIVELGNKALMATNTSVVILFLRKKPKEKLIEIVNTCQEACQKECPPNKEELLNRLHNIKDEVEKFRYITDDCDGLLWNTICKMEAGWKVLIAFSGEKKKQEHFLGYRFSKARGREGLIELSKGLLIDKQGHYSNNCLATLIHNRFLGIIEESPPSELDKHMMYVELPQIVKPREDHYVISTPSSLITLKTTQISSLSPQGDFIDRYEQTETSIGKLVEEGKLEVIQGVTYDKTRDELPTETEVQVLTASNIAINSGLIDLKEKVVYLRSDFKFDEKMRIRKYDIIMSMSSGSLKHLGKVAIATENMDYIIGGFLIILRAKDPKLALALYYRLLSQQFRKYVYSRKGQNINNLNLNELKLIPLELPKDLNAFVKEVKGRGTIPKLLEQGELTFED